MRETLRNEPIKHREDPCLIRHEPEITAILDALKLVKPKKGKTRNEVNLTSGKYRLDWGADHQSVRWGDKPWPK
jgi:hypothetical protein